MSEGQSDTVRYRWSLVMETNFPFCRAESKGGGRHEAADSSVAICRAGREPHERLARRRRGRQAQ